MKMLSLILVALSVLALGSIFGFSLFILTMGIMSGLMTLFAIVSYLKSAQRDYPGFGYENQSVKYGLNFSNM